MIEGSKSNEEIGHAKKGMKNEYPTCEELGVLSVPDDLGLRPGSVDDAAEFDLGVLLDLHPGPGLETGDLDFRGWHCDEERGKHEISGAKGISGGEQKQQLIASIF